MLRVIAGNSWNQKQKATLGNSWGCLLAGMKKVISELIGLWQKCSMSFWCVRLYCWSRGDCHTECILCSRLVRWAGSVWGWRAGSVRAGRWVRCEVARSGGFAKEVLKELGWEVRELLAKTCTLLLQMACCATVTLIQKILGTAEEWVSLP